MFSIHFLHCFLPYSWKNEWENKVVIYLPRLFLLLSHFSIIHVCNVCKIFSIEFYFFSTIILFIPKHKTKKKEKAAGFTVKKWGFSNKGYFLTGIMKELKIFYTQPWTHFFLKKVNGFKNAQFPKNRQ